MHRLVNGVRVEIPEEEADQIMKEREEERIRRQEEKIALEAEVERKNSIWLSIQSKCNLTDEELQIMRGKDA